MLTRLRRWFSSSQITAKSSLASKKWKVRLSLDSLEDRLCPDGTVIGGPGGSGGTGTLRQIQISNSNVTVQLTLPTTFTTLLANAVDPNSGGVLDFSTLTIVSQGLWGRAITDPT